MSLNFIIIFILLHPSLALIPLKGSLILLSLWCFWSSFSSNRWRFSRAVNTKEPQNMSASERKNGAEWIRTIRTIHGEKKCGDTCFKDSAWIRSDHAVQFPDNYCLITSADQNPNNFPKLDNFRVGMGGGGLRRPARKIRFLSKLVALVIENQISKSYIRKHVGNNA